jgi:hypothetical protein
MKGLPDLFYSLIAVIIRYHDAHVSEKLIIESNYSLLTSRSRAYSPQILTNTTDKYEDTLNNLVAKCTAKYDSRKHLLYYLVNEIVFLKTLLDKKESFSSSELDQYKAVITQMLLNFKQLILTPKSATCSVKYSKIDFEPTPPITLNGLVNSGYLSDSLCFSGILFAEVLSRFNLSSTSSDEEMRDIADSLCMEHQNSLLVPELEQQKKRQAKVIETEQAKITSLNKQLKDLQKEYSAKTLQLERTLAKIKELEKPSDSQPILPISSGVKIEPRTETELLDAQRTIKEQVTVSSLRNQKFSPHSIGLFGLYNPLFLPGNQFPPSKTTVLTKSEPVTPKPM